MKGDRQPEKLPRRRRPTDRLGPRAKRLLAVATVAGATVLILGLL